MRREVSRGTPRLVVEVPVRLGQLRRLYLVICVGIFAAQFLTFRLLDGEWSVFALWFSAAVALLAFIFTTVLGDAWSSRETIEVDPRFLTVTRGDGMASFSLRAECTDVWLNRATALGVRGPRIAWGSDGKPCGSAGMGLSDHDASQVVAAIADFLASNPPEPGFDYLVETGAR